MTFPWRGLRDLGPRRWPDVVELGLLALLVDGAIRVVPLPRLARWLGTPLRLDGQAAPPGRLPDLELTPAERDRMDIAWRLLRRPPFNGTCLRRALVGGHVLRRRRPALRIGVTKIDRAVAAHAWVEVDGVSLDADAAVYGPLYPPRRRPVDHG